MGLNVIHEMSQKIPQLWPQNSKILIIVWLFQESVTAHLTQFVVYTNHQKGGDFQTVVFVSLKP